MAGFASLDQVINALAVNAKGQQRWFQKTVPSTNVANILHTLWKANGVPGAGTDPTNGLGNAAACDDTTTGALWFANPTNPATLHLLGMNAFNATGYGSLILCDRLAHINLNHNANGSISPALDGTARLGTGEGGQLIMEVTGAFSGASNTINFSYTDQDGNSGTTPNLATVASAVVGRLPFGNGYTFLPLAAGDVGVRTVTAVTLVSGSATGTYNLVLVRPLAVITCVGAGVGCEYDLVVSVPSLPRIRDDSCLCFYFISSTASSSWTWAGQLRAAEN